MAGKRTRTKKTGLKMSGVLETFYIMFEANASKLQQGLKDAQAEAGKTANGMMDVDKAAEVVGEKLMQTAKKLLGVLGLGLSVKEFAKNIEQTAAYNVELSKLAARFNSTTEEVNQFMQQNKLLGISTDQAQQSLESLNRSIEDTAMGMGRGAKIYEELGISVKDAAGNIKPTLEVLGELQNKFKNIGKGQQIRIMERLGLDPSLLKMFNANMGDLNNRIKAVDDATGYSLQVATKNSAEFIKAQKELKMEGESILMFFEKLGSTLMVNAMPYFTEGIKKASEIMHSFFNFITEHGHFVKAALAGVAIAIGAMLVPSLYSMAAGAWAALVPFVLLNLPIILIGLGIVALIGLFALLYDDIMTFSEGGQSLLGELLDFFGISVKDFKETWGTIWDDIVYVFKFCLNFLIDYWTFIFKAMAKWCHFLYNVVGTMIKGIIGYWKGVYNTMMAIWEFAKDMFTNPSKALDNFLQKMAKILPNLESIKNILSSLGLSSGTEEEKKKKLEQAQIAEAAQKGLAAGKAQIATATQNPIAAQTSGSILNSKSNVTKNNNVNVAKIEINAQGADSNEIAKHIDGHLKEHAKNTNAQWDDGMMF